LLSFVIMPPEMNKLSDAGGDARVALEASVPVALWGSLAFELVLRAVPVGQILATYNVTEAQLSVLLDTPAFQATLKDAAAQVKQHGADAGFVLRARALSEDLLPDIYRIAKNDLTDGALRHKIFETLSRYAQLDPATNKKPGGGDGVQVIFNLGAGIRGLGHVVAEAPVAPVVQTMPEVKEP
jgi:hypothetical protein